MRLQDRDREREGGRERNGRKWGCGPKLSSTRMYIYVREFQQPQGLCEIPCTDGSTLGLRVYRGWVRSAYATIDFEIAENDPKLFTLAAALYCRALCVIKRGIYGTTLDFERWIFIYVTAKYVLYGFMGMYSCGEGSYLLIFRTFLWPAAYSDNIPLDCDRKYTFFQ